MGLSQIYDDIVQELGDFGSYQIRQYILLIFPIVFSAAFCMSYIFAAGTVSHRCLVEQCGDQNESSPFLPPWWTEAIPSESDGSPSSCSMYAPLNVTATTVTSNLSTPTPPLDKCSEHFDNSSVQTCDQWVYDGRERTILTEFTLTCAENRWKLTLVGTVNNFGRFVGLPFSGYLGDRFGRKVALLVTVLGAAVLGIIRAMSFSYVFFLSFEFLEEIFTGGIYGIAFIMIMEQMTPGRRIWTSGIAACSFALGEAMLGILAWALRDWRYILFAVYAPAFLFVSYIWLLPESIRWLIMRGRVDEALIFIRKAAKENKLQLSPEIEAKLVHFHDIVEENEQESSKPTIAALKEVIHSKRLLLSLTISFIIWFLAEHIYFGLSVNSVTLAGTNNIYLNFVLVGLAEIPGYLLSMLGMAYIGRRNCLCLTLLVSGFACLAQPFSDNWVELTLYLIGKLTSSASVGTLWVFTAELFPTEIRTTMLSACHMIGRVGGMLATQTPLLIYVSPLLPMVMFGVMSLIAGLLSLFLSETKNLTLPDSVQDDRYKN